MTRLAFDPGTRSLGYATFEDGGVLISAGALRGVGALDMISKIEKLWSRELTAQYSIVVELPQVYQASRAKGDPNDMIQIALVVGAICTRGPAQLVTPHTWKGSAPKDVMHGRIRNRLTDGEAARLNACLAAIPKTSHADALDAVGVGLWSFCRL